MDGSEGPDVANGSHCDIPMGRRQREVGQHGDPKPGGDKRARDRDVVDLMGDVRVETGIRAELFEHYARRPGGGGGLVTVLELERERPGRAVGPLLALTAREREVAALVAEGLADREIAERLRLSRHTVSQYVKRIYRKLGVGSRVALTRLLLAPARPDRPSDRPSAGPQDWGPLEQPQPSVLPAAAGAA
jgi:DNA-binding CsgD family transcriptional regulator